MSGRVLRPRDKSRLPKRYGGEASSGPLERSTLSTPAMSQFDPTLIAAFPTLDFMRPDQESTETSTKSDEDENQEGEQRAALVFRPKRGGSDSSSEEEKSDVNNFNGNEADVNDSSDWENMDPGDWDNMELDIQQGKGENWDSENEGGVKPQTKETVKWSSITPGIRIIILKELTTKWSIFEATKLLGLTSNDVTELIQIRKKELERVTVEDAKMNYWNARCFSGEITSTQALEEMCKTDDGSPLEDPPGWINSKKDLKTAKRFLRGVGLPEIAAKMWEYHGIGSGRGFSPILYMLFPGEPGLVAHGAGRPGADDPGGSEIRAKEKSGQATAEDFYASQDDDDDADPNVDDPQAVKGSLSGKDDAGLPRTAKKRKRPSKIIKLKVGPSRLRDAIAADQDGDMDTADGQFHLGGMREKITGIKQTEDSITVATPILASVTEQKSETIADLGCPISNEPKARTKTEPLDQDMGLDIGQEIAETQKAKPGRRRKKMKVSIEVEKAIEVEKPGSLMGDPTGPIPSSTGPRPLTRSESAQALAVEKASSRPQGSAPNPEESKSKLVIPKKAAGMGDKPPATIAGEKQPKDKNAGKEKGKGKGKGKEKGASSSKVIVKKTVGRKSKRTRADDSDA